jgi:hypothetical protein
MLIRSLLLTYLLGASGVVYDAPAGAPFTALSGDIAATGAGVVTVTDLSLTSEARGDIARRNASTWGRLSAKTAGQLLLGDGTDVISAALGGDVSSVDGAGSVTIANPTRLLTATVNLTATEIVGTSAGSLGGTGGVTLVTGTSGKIIVPVMVVVDYTRVTASYTTDVNLTVRYATANLVASSNCNSNTTFTAGASGVMPIIPSTTNGASGAAVKGDSLALVGSAGITQPGTAAGTAKITTYYHLVTPP